ncbi:AB hydrolase-1 domain-containing protein [Mycena indigotica]|uniref:AB hydrolase-1 domain-containing protein n=1 Tax=Mycena indigotica TaxID=2126181 RepID=A0A8H6SNA4_9AGAR|nr:AB hydrolase-1 domain-containing protein [Mycena indigotica]KAF7301942.1 AB hydrolase-1 domain-containing protein [Mycena indigotica]
MAQTRYFSQHDANTNGEPPSSNAALTLAYRTFGNPANPVVFIPSCFSGKLDTTLTFLYLPSADNTPPVLQDYFCIVCGLLGGRRVVVPVKFSRFSPRPTHALCLSLGVTKLYAYIGFSMGGQQAYHMAVLFPQFADRVVVIAASARTSWHNYSFLEGPKAALVNSVDFHDGNYQTPAVRGTRAFARVYATWALSQAWFRAHSWETLGYKDLEEYLRVVWEGGRGGWDAHDLLAMIHTWQGGDISQFGPEEDKGDLAKALGRIQARVLLMPSRSDFYFPPEDSAEEVKYLKHGELRVIESIWGHIAGGGGGTKEDNEFIKAEIKRFLTS